MSQATITDATMNLTCRPRTRESRLLTYRPAGCALRMTADEVLVAPAREEDYEWCAQLMAVSEPWITLGRGLEDCQSRCRHPEYLLLVARRGRAVRARGLGAVVHVAAQQRRCSARRRIHQDESA